MKLRLTIILARLYAKQNKTWGEARSKVGRQIWRMYKVIDRCGYFWRDLLPEAEILSVEMAV